MNIKPIIKPILNNFPFLYDWLKLGTGGTDSADYCYSVWLRHLVMVRQHGLGGVPAVVAELGPGDSLGVGLAALLCGVEKYYALDVKTYANPERNRAVLERLAGMFAERHPIPDAGTFPLIKPTLKDYSFPRFLLPNPIFEHSLDHDNIAALQSEVAAEPPPGQAPRIFYQSPWQDESVIKENSVDLVVAQAVLEHVEDIETTYRTLARWLKPGAYLSLDIDFKCHNTTWRWNGHWSVGPGLWKIIRGRREWGINREPWSRHRDAILKAGFEIIDTQIETRDDGIKRENLHPDFSFLSDEDVRAAGVYVLARREL